MGNRRPAQRPIRRLDRSRKRSLRSRRRSAKSTCLLHLPRQHRVRHRRRKPVSHLNLSPPRTNRRLPRCRSRRRLPYRLPPCGRILWTCSGRSIPCAILRAAHGCSRVSSSGKSPQRNWRAPPAGDAARGISLDRGGGAVVVVAALPGRSPCRRCQVDRGLPRERGRRRTAATPSPLCRSPPR